MAKITPQVGLIGNDTEISIKLVGDSTYTPIAGASDITLPDQTFNGVELPYLKESDGITDRIKGSRNGGDMTFNINAKSVEDAGLGKVIEAAEDKTNECSFQLTFANGATAVIERVVVLGCTMQQVAKDTIISYAVSCACNSVLSFTNAE
nr:MAG TPA: tail tube protein [Caudoviricetes sp.]